MTTERGRRWVGRLTSWGILAAPLLVYLVVLAWPAVTSRDGPRTAGVLLMPLLTVGIWLAITAPVRSVSGWTNFWALAVGLTVVPVVSAVLAWPFGQILDRDSVAVYVVPVLEESAKLIPLAYLLVRPIYPIPPISRVALGAVDLAILGLAAGTGFQLAEDHLRLRFTLEHMRFDPGWGPFGLFPHTPYTLGVWRALSKPFFLHGPGHIAMGHGVWTGLVGLGLGLSLTFGRRLGRWCWAPLIVAGAIAIWEHAAFNLMAGLGRDAPPDWLLFTYIFLTQGGRLSGYLFALGVLAALAWTAWLVYPPRDPFLDVRWLRLRLVGSGPRWQRVLHTGDVVVAYIRAKAAAANALGRYRNGTASWPETERALAWCSLMKGVLERKLPWAEGE